MDEFVIKQLDNAIYDFRCRTGSEPGVIIVGELVKEVIKCKMLEVIKCEMLDNDPFSKATIDTRHWYKGIPVVVGVDVPKGLIQVGILDDYSLPCLDLEG